MQEFLSRPSDSSEEINGFTLVEIAIVIVIIGLLVGGILLGKDLGAVLDN